MKLIAAVLASCLLSACAGIPDIAPTISLENGAEFSPVEGTTDATLPDDWWQLYEDPQLDKLVALALASNADLRVAYRNLDAVRALRKQARVAQGPQSTVESGLTVDDSANQPSAFAVPSTDWDLGITASWELDLFGRLRAEALAAEAEYGAQQAVVYGVKVAVVADTVQAYLDLCGATQAATVANQVVERQQRYVDLLEMQRAAGEISPFEVSQAASQAASLRAAVHPFIAQRANALYQLAALQGVSPTDARSFDIHCDTSPRLRDAAPIGDANALLRRRPDIREAKLRLLAAAARANAAETDLYPRLNLGAALGILSGNFASFATPLLSWSFPIQGPTRARIARSSALERAALANWDAVILRALLDVESALSLFDAERRRNLALIAATNEAKIYARGAAARVRVGDSSALVQVDAERTLASARLVQVQSNIAITRAHVALFRALGGGWLSDS